MYDPGSQMGNQMGNVGPGSWEYQNEVQAIRDGDMEALRQRDLWRAEQREGRQIAGQLGARAGLLWLIIIAGFVGGAAFFGIPGLIIGTVLGITTASIVNRRIR